MCFFSNLSNEPASEIALVIEVIKLTTLAVRHFPYELDEIRWDFVRLALSSWVLTTSKSVKSVNTEKIALFTVAVFQLFAEMEHFVAEEKKKSSTELLVKVIEEWENVFAEETSLVLLKTFMNIIESVSNAETFMQRDFLTKLANELEWINLKLVVEKGQLDKNISLNDVISFCINSICNSTQHSVRFSAATLFKNLAPQLVQLDLVLLQQADVNRESDQNEWHLLFLFEEKLTALHTLIKDFETDLKLKSPQGEPVTRDIDRSTTLSFLLLWDSILFVCSAAPAELRSVYTAWITQNNLQDVLLSFLVNLFPAEVLNNADSGFAVFGQTVFAKLDWNRLAGKLTC